MAEYQADKLIIQIDAETKTAKKNIKDLKKELRNINKDIDLPDLSSLNKKLYALGNNLSSINKISFDNLGKLKSINSISSAQLDKVSQSLNAISNVINKSNIKPIANGIKEITSEESTLSKTKDDISGIAFNMQSMYDAINNEALNKMTYTFGQMKDNLDGVVISADKFVIITASGKLSLWDRLAQKIAIIKDEIKKAGGLSNVLATAWRKSEVWAGGLSDKIGGLIKSVKRISFYRIIRALVQLIGKAIKESINNLYSFSDSIGGSFAKSMDNIKTSITYFINSFATIVAPIIETLEPLITFLLDAIATLNNLIGAFFQGLTGSSGITQATKELVKFKNATLNLGIDELNTANQSSGLFSIFGGDGQEESVINKLLSSITDGLQPIFDIIGKLGVKIGQILSTIVSLLEPVIELLNSIFGLLDDILNPLLDLLDGVLDPLIEVLEILVDLFASSLAPAITLVKDLLGSLGTFFNQVFGGIITIVKNFLTIWKSVFELVSAIFTGNTEKIQQAWENMWKGIGNFFIGIVNGIITGFEAFINLFVNAINAITQAISSIWTWTGIPAIPKIPQASIPRIPYFATGGVVEDGLFMANHNELIGGFSNGKTAVANNEQITTGIYNAVKDALQESGFGNSNSTQQEIKVYLDSKEIAKQVNKVNKENGVAIYSGATSYAK